MNDLQKKYKELALPFLSHIDSRVISVESMPKNTGNNCQITLNIPWETVYQILAFASPFLSTLTKTFDDRTKLRREEQEAHARRTRVNIKREIVFEKAFYKTIRRIYTDNLSYHKFQRELCIEMGGNGDYSDSYTIEPYLSFISQGKLREVYSRLKTWSIQRKRKKGFSVEQIAKMQNIKSAQVYHYLKKDRKHKTVRKKTRMQEIIDWSMQANSPPIDEYF